MIQQVLTIFLLLQEVTQVKVYDHRNSVISISVDHGNSGIAKETIAKFVNLEIRIDQIILLTRLTENQLFYHCGFENP